jgi:hypothetical protein
MNQRDHATRPNETPFISIITALGGEFSELGRFIEQLQSVLSPALLRLADDPGCHRNVQMLDLLAQRLNVLSIFLTALSQSVPPTLIIDAQAALDSVNLSELAWRLQGLETSYTALESGSLEIF